MPENLPEDLSTLGPERLEHARTESDALLAPLFRRWPALSKVELRELRRLYDERLRLAKYVGSLRKAGPFGTYRAHRLRKGDLMTSPDIWTYREPIVGGVGTPDIVGFHVEALDGSIGKIDEATYDAGSAYIVVDTGPWIFGKKVHLPAGVIRSVDTDEEKVYVNRTKEQIKNAPEFEFEESQIRDDSYRTRLGSYYGPGVLGT
jgi:hypothetical protein